MFVFVQFNVKAWTTEANHLSAETTRRNTQRKEFLHALFVAFSSSKHQKHLAGRHESRIFAKIFLYRKWFLSRFVKWIFNSVRTRDRSRDNAFVYFFNTLKIRSDSYFWIRDFLLFLTANVISIVVIFSLHSVFLEKFYDLVFLKKQLTHVYVTRETWVLDSAFKMWWLTTGPLL